METATLSTPLYKEELPDECPPAHAIDSELKKVCRFLLFEPAKSERNFWSRAQLEKKPTSGGSECSERSCSLFVYSEAARAAARIGFFRTKKVAILDVPTGSGVHIKGTNGHVDFWMYDSFDPLKAIETICDTAEDVKGAVSDG